MSYTELESGYQGLKQTRPGFYVGHDGNVSFVSCWIFLICCFCEIFISIAQMKIKKMNCCACAKNE